MKLMILFFSTLFILSCDAGKKSIQDENTYPRKDRFIVSENDKKSDSLKIKAKKNGYEVEPSIDILGKENSTGEIHFLIENKNRTYYVEKPNFILLCGNVDASDSIFFLKENELYLDSIKFIQTDSISNFLQKNKSKIIANKIRGFPGTISFALKNDTLEGSFMHDIIKFMEENQMKNYFIRRMNDAELKAIQKFRK